MRKINFLPVAFAFTVLAASCSKDVKVSQAEIPQSDVNAIAAMGFSTDGVRPADGGYIVEGDMFLSNESLKKGLQSQSYVVASEEHYRTTNLVKGLPRTITISISGFSNPAFSSALDEAVRRYNAENLQITFSRVASGGNMVVTGQYWAATSSGIILGESAGFPDAAGNPAPGFKLNTNPQAFGTNPNVNYLASVMAHEMGHAIGFRHTDYMNRAYSCGGRRYNEGSAGVGAVWITGTPTKADANSWMLACTAGTDRPFTANDKIALSTVY